MFSNQSEQEEYERQRNLNLARGIIYFFIKYIGYGFMWIFTSTITGTIINNLFKINVNISAIIGAFIGFMIFKIPYVKQHPFKSTIMICFIFGLFLIAFPENS